MSHRSISTFSFHDNIHGAKREGAAAGLWRTVQQLQHSTQVTDPLASFVVHSCALVRTCSGWCSSPAWARPVVVVEGYRRASIARARLHNFLENGGRSLCSETETIRRFGVERVRVLGHYEVMVQGKGMYYLR